MKEIALSGARGAGLTVLVDDDLYDQVATKRWYLHSDGYVVGGRGIYMHRVVLGIVGEPHSVVADHINGNRLDNRKANLRRATVAQNVVRRSEGKDAGLVEIAPGRWRVRVGKAGCCDEAIVLGTLEEARAARNDMLVKRYGADFAPLMPTEAREWTCSKRRIKPPPRACVDCGKTLGAKSGEPNRVARNPTPRCRQCDSRAKCSAMNVRKGAA